MIVLANSSTSLQLVTNSNSQIVYSVDWDDLAEITTSLARGTNVGNIVTATATTIVGSPAPAVQRSVKQITLKNDDPSNNATVLLQKFDGVNAWDISANVVLQPQYLYVYIENHGYIMYDNTGLPLANNSGI